MEVDSRGEIPEVYYGVVPDEESFSSLLREYKNRLLESQRYATELQERMLVDEERRKEELRRRRVEEEERIKKEEEEDNRRKEAIQGYLLKLETLINDCLYYENVALQWQNIANRKDEKVDNDNGYPKCNHKPLICDHCKQQTDTL